MFRARKRLITLLIASTFAIAAGVAASDIAGLTADDTHTHQSEIQQPAPEALLPPITPGNGAYRM
jgi:hypothetical protein